ncbi:PTS system mannose/fructose/sorbose family transporter subunit IID [Enterococcus sp. 669A]|uniref:PTS system mannose/fructose/sorbose family transporter subunit IID n=1 Tax=Candidatus Enterococcus moelleringii TaxID=2815325 RepID=A0ABS3LEP2_9ENTE|nr:PTS system mannose/fructose/sorbose family transporter subunit IID [Enterococcus sp. 669A]MBO1308102.1 PTS system mannose/fructose/sorbose family transporter subunit IID [Enterococcus sp. 669A]
MIVSAILVALLATMGQWWFFGPVTKCLVYPLTTGFLVGIFMGDPMTGMLAGANIQLIYLGWISAGGTMPSNTIVAGIFGTAMTILSDSDPTMAVTFAIPFSMLGLLLNQVYMTVNAAWIHQADKLLDKGNLSGVRLMNFVPSFCMAFLLYGIPAFLLVYSGSSWAQQLINFVPENVISALEVVGGIMPALGIAMLLNYLGKRNLIPWFFGGFFLTVYSGLSLTAISIFSAIIALVMYLNSNKGSEQPEKKKVKRLSVTKEVKTVEVAKEAEAAPVVEYQKKLSKNTLVKTWLWTTSTEACYNYERLQALGAANLMITPIRALYDTNEERVRELRKYMVFYNSEVFTIGPIINGIACSMEEARANGEDVQEKDINAVRTGLMGPVAGIGDTVMQGILFPIIFGIGCSMALDGSYLGPILSFVVFEALIFGCGYFMFMTGYKQGKNSLLKILKNGTIDRIINSFSIVGLMVVGSMAATRVAVNTPLAVTVGEGVTKIQDVLDSLAPGLIPLGITLLVWWMLKRKISTVWIIVAIFVVGILGFYLGILGYAA